MSTRGNSEAIVGSLVLVALYFLMRQQEIISALFFGLAIHFKIYPIIFSVAIFFFIDREKPFRRGNFLLGIAEQFSRPRRIRYALITVATIGFLTWVLYKIYGWTFLYETYLYHVIRKDHRHNFSIYFYQMYLSSSAHDVVTPSASTAIFSGPSKKKTKQNKQTNKQTEILHVHVPNYLSQNLLLSFFLFLFFFFFFLLKKPSLIFYFVCSRFGCVGARWRVLASAPFVGCFDFQVLSERSPVRIIWNDSCFCRIQQSLHGAVLHLVRGFFFFLPTMRVLMIRASLRYFSLLPLIVSRLNVSLKEYGLVFAFWMGTQGLWLGLAFLLEFHGRNTFLWIWLASIGFFASHIGSLCFFVNRHAELH